MFESKSPFDEAAAHPFLDEPVKKRWSWLTISTATSSSSSERRDSSISVDYREYKAPKINTEVIDFLNDSSDEEEELTLDLEQGKMVEVDLALLHERHADISEINTSMKEINQIQKDLAQVVDSHDEHFHKFETMAIESLDHASAGVSHLLAMQQYMDQASKKRKKMLAATATLLLVIVAAHWLSNCVVQNYDGPPIH